jgi:hypothetical protein
VAEGMHKMCMPPHSLPYYFLAKCLFFIVNSLVFFLIADWQQMSPTEGQYFRKQPFGTECNRPPATAWITVDVIVYDATLMTIVFIFIYCMRNFFCVHKCTILCERVGKPAVL